MELEFNENGFIIKDSTIWRPITVNINRLTIDEIIKIFMGKRPRSYYTDTEYWAYSYNHKVTPTFNNPLSINYAIPVRFFKDIVKELKEKKKFRNKGITTPHTKDELSSMSITELNRLYNNLYSW